MGASTRPIYCSNKAVASLANWYLPARLQIRTRAFFLLAAPGQQLPALPAPTHQVLDELPVNTAYRHVCAYDEPGDEEVSFAHFTGTLWVTPHGCTWPLLGPMSRV
jgi:hypothetical protein